MKPARASHSGPDGLSLRVVSHHRYATSTYKHRQGKSPSYYGWGFITHWFFAPGPCPASVEAQIAADVVGCTWGRVVGRSMHELGCQVRAERLGIRHAKRGMGLDHLPVIAFTVKDCREADPLLHATR